MKEDLIDIFAPPSMRESSNGAAKHIQISRLPRDSSLKNALDRDLHKCFHKQIKTSRKYKYSKLTYFFDYYAQVCSTTLTAITDVTV